MIKTIIFALMLPAQAASSSQLKQLPNPDLVTVTFLIKEHNNVF